MKLIKHKTYQMQNLSNSKLIKRKTSETTKLIKRKTYQTQNLSNAKLIIHKTYRNTNRLEKRPRKNLSRFKRRSQNREDLKAMCESFDSRRLNTFNFLILPVLSQMIKPSRKM